MEMSDLKAAIDEYSDAVENEMLSLKKRLDGVEHKLNGNHKPYPGWRFITDQEGAMHHVPTYKTLTDMISGKDSLQERLESAEETLSDIVACVPQGEDNNRLVSVANYARSYFANCPQKEKS